MLNSKDGSGIHSKTNLVFCFLLVLLLTGLAVAPGLANAIVSGPANTPWPMFHHDPQHTGLSPYLGAQTNTLKWTFTASSLIRGSPVIGSDGTVYIAGYGGTDNRFYAIDPNGDPKWPSVSLPYGSRSAAAIAADGTIYVSAHYFYAFNPDGTTKWVCTAAADCATSPVIGSDGTIYVGVSIGPGGGLYAIRDNGTSGSVKWFYSTPGVNNESAPAIGSDGTIYFGTHDYNLYAISDNGTSGILKWTFPTGYWINSSPAIGSDGTIYVGSYDSFLYAITDNGTSGIQKWRFNAEGDIGSSPAIGVDGTIYFGSPDYDSGPVGRLYALTDNVTNYILKWDYPLTGLASYIVDAPAIGNDKTIYVGDFFGNVSAIKDNSTSGNLTWSYTTGDWVIGSAAIGSDGTVYIGSYDRKLYAFNSTPRIASVSPNSGYQGTTLNNVIITGANFTGATDVNFGDGITVSSPNTDNSTQIRVNITIAAGATPGARDVSVTTPDGTGTKTGGFTVLQPTQSVNTATGTGTATFTTSAGSINSLTALAESALACTGNPGASFPHGFFSFTITGIPPGSTVTITITLPSNMPAGTQYWKCINGTWVDCTSLLGDNDGDNILTLTIRDGGLGDSSPTTDGMIVDPGGPALPVSGATVPAQPAHRASPTPPNQFKRAQMSLQYLNVNPQQAAANQPVNITTNVVNTGDEAGNLNVALKINGQVEQSRMVSVGPQGTQPVKFTLTRAQPGTYAVDIGGQKGSFTILGTGSGTPGSPANGGLIAILIIGALIIATVAVLMLTFRRTT